MENAIQPGTYQWDLVLDEQTQKNDEVYGITEYGYDILTLTPDSKFTYKHYLSYCTDDYTTGKCSTDVRTMNLQGSTTIETPGLWTCVIEKSDCRTGYAKELVGSFKLEAQPGNAIAIKQAQVTSADGKPCKYASSKLKNVFQRKEK